MARAVSSSLFVSAATLGTTVPNLSHVTISLPPGGFGQRLVGVSNMDAAHCDTRLAGLEDRAISRTMLQQVFVVFQKWILHQLAHDLHQELILMQQQHGNDSRKENEDDEDIAVGRFADDGYGGGDLQLVDTHSWTSPVTAATPTTTPAGGHAMMTNVCFPNCLPFWIWI